MIVFLGDVALLDQNLVSDYKITNYPYVVNFEYVTGETRHSPVDGKINLYSPCFDFARIFGKKPIAAVIANNHTFDFGEQGFKQTLSVLQNEKIHAVGADGAWINSDACLLAYSLVGGEKSCEFDKSKVAAKIKAFREQGAKRIIVNVHWGVENHPCVNGMQKEIGHWLIDSGADLVIGHHPHCIQSIEMYKGKYICYSLGNCLFPNFSVESHFYGGKPTRKYRFKWQWWNRKSISVNYDESTGNITVDELYMKKNFLKCKKYNANIKKYERICFEPLADVIYRLRKYYLFFRSNFLVDGKLFDLSAIKAEVNKR